MSRSPSALGYALPLIIAIAAVGGFTAYKVSSATATIGVTAVAPDAGSVAAAVNSGDGEVRWLKGQTHAHTNQGPDSVEPVDSVLAFYADAGFDFVVLTDHNHVTVATGPEGLLVIPGAEMTQTRERCEPMPEGAKKCAMHMNALFVDPTRVENAFLEPPSDRIIEVYRAQMLAGKQMGALVQLNHPNYEYSAADVELLVTLSNEGLRFIEVMNEAKDVNSAGDEKHPNVEALWTTALSRGAKLYAIASDDAHNYSDAAEWAAKGNSPSIVNQGFIYVRAKKDPLSIRAAMERGNFYASNGVRLLEVAVFVGEVGARGLPLPPQPGLSITVAPEHAAPLIRFLGDEGQLLQEVRGHRASQQITAGGRFIRAVVEADGKRALTQPFFTAE